MPDTHNITLEQAFEKPSAAYRPAPFWVWNDDIRPVEIRRQLKELAACGFGGAFVHPRPGLVTEYLSEAWFGLWQEALVEAERLGLKLYIYDENSYPSGFAGGHVSSELPDCLANCVHFKEYEREQLSELGHLSSPMLNRPGHPIRVFAVGESNNGSKWEVLRDITLLPVSEWSAQGERFWVYELGTPETNNWLGGFAYTDLLRPEVTTHFLRTTHEQYAKRFGDRFGGTIPAFFTDEPEISPGNLFQDGDSFLPFTYWFASEFEKRNGYDLLDYLPFLFRDAVSSSLPKDAQQVRYDFYSTMHELWTNNSVRPISEWCERNNLAYTGHYIEHNWPHPFNRSSPSVMSMHEYMHWPAVDVLSSQMLRVEHATAEGYNEKSTQLLICIREAQSAANQFDRERVLCEAYGAGGWDSSFEDYKRIGDWLFVHGINFLNHHLTYYTIAGARKRDHPQSFDWRQPWWEEFQELNHYFSRLSYLLSQGKTRNRILVLNPTTSSYLHTPRDLKDNAVYLRDINLTRELAQRLSDCGWDYDWGDEFILERHGAAEEGKLTINKRTYDLVIVPPAMQNMKTRTIELLQQYMASGGMVIAWEGDGLKRSEGAAWSPKELISQIGWVNTACFDELEAEVRSRLQPHVEWHSGTNERYRVAVLRRDMEDGSKVYFIANSTPQMVKDVARIRGARGEVWNPLDGSICSLTGTTIDGKLEFPVELEASGSLLLRIYDEAEVRLDDQPRNSPFLSAAIHTKLESDNCLVTPERANLLPLSYCDLKVGSKTYTGIYAAQASRLAFEHHGFSANPWDNGIQFKRRLLERNETFDERTGISVEYRFTIRQGEIPPAIEVMLERPELYRISVNGAPIRVEPGTCWMDHLMGQASIRSAVHEGDNVIRLEGKPFSIFMEIETIFVTGDFAVEEDEGRWVIGVARPLSVGSWREQGYPFYGSAMTYRKQIGIDASVNSAALVLRNWLGSIASVAVNGKAAGLIGLDRSDRLDLSDYIVSGTDNEITVRVSGSFKNTLGPFFDLSRPRKVAWPKYWKESPMFGPPPADSYDLIDYGLFEDFYLEVGTKKSETDGS